MKERNRILICAPSNAAVDEIVKRLLNSPPRLPSTVAAVTTEEKQAKRNCGDFNLLRIGYNVEPALRHCTMEYLADQKMNSMKFQHNPDAIQKELKKLNQVLEALDKVCVKLKMSCDPKEKHEQVIVPLISKMIYYLMTFACSSNLHADRRMRMEYSMFLFYEDFMEYNTSKSKI